MLKIILNSTGHLAPFNERVRDLRIQNKPLWLLQRDVLAKYADREVEVPHGASLPETREACIVYRDNLFFDQAFIDEFIQHARKRKVASRAALKKDDPAFREHTLPLSKSYQPEGENYLVDLWYYPEGPQVYSEPLIVDLEAREIGYYRVPKYMATETGDLVFQVPLKALLAIDSWVHIFIADVVFGLFSRGARFEKMVHADPFAKLRTLGKAIWEGRQVLESSELVQIGKNCIIDPSAVIHGPTSIGDNVNIGAGVVIDNCIIGNHVNISQGCQLLLSTIGDGCFLPFRAALFMSTLMDNSMVAQNACLQMCVLGRNTFIGAGTTFTDFSLVPSPIQALDGEGSLQLANREVLGGCVGHNCRIGSGMLIMPARTIRI